MYSHYISHTLIHLGETIKCMFSIRELIAVKLMTFLFKCICHFNTVTLKINYVRMSFMCIN